MHPLCSAIWGEWPHSPVPEGKVVEMRRCGQRSTAGRVHQCGWQREEVHIAAKCERWSILWIWSIYGRAVLAAAACVSTLSTYLVSPQVSKASGSEP